jgi:Flp pilus assembly protein TadG
VRAVKGELQADDQALSGRTARSGAITVELALVVPVILFMLFSILEMGFMVKNRAELGQSARESVRLAAVGATPSRMTTGLNSNLNTIDSNNVSVTYEYRTWDENSGAWGSWTTLGSDGTNNNASVGDQIRVRVTYSHPLLFPSVMGPAIDANEDGTKDLSASVVMMRE